MVHTKTKPKWIKVYHEARVTQDKKNVEFKMEAMMKEDAIKLEKQMKKGEGIFSPNRDAADDLYKAVTGKNPPGKIDLHHQGGGQYPHYHTDKERTIYLWWPKE